MTKVLTLRLAPEELAWCDARARELGVTRTDYVRSRLFEAQPATEKKGKRPFVSRDLIGSRAVGTGSTNNNVRAALAKRSRAS